MALYYGMITGKYRLKLNTRLPISEERLRGHYNRFANGETRTANTRERLNDMIMRVAKICWAAWLHLKPDRDTRVLKHYRHRLQGEAN